MILSFPILLNQIGSKSLLLAKALQNLIRQQKLKSANFREVKTILFLKIWLDDKIINSINFDKKGDYSLKLVIENYKKK